MAEALLGAMAQVILRKVASLATEEISHLWGLQKDLQRLGEKLEMIQALLYDAGSKHVSSSRAVRLWLKKLQTIASDADDVLDKFGYDILRRKVEKISQRKGKKVRSFFSSSNPLVFRLGIAREIKNIISLVEEVYKESNEIGLRAVDQINRAPEHKEIKQTDPFLGDPHIVERADDISNVVNMLINMHNEMDVSVVGIVGLSGLGRSTLAKLVYNNEQVVKYFHERMWIYVSDDFAVERLLNEMLQSLNQAEFNLTNREGIVKKLQGYLNGKRYLLVLDDVWNEDGDKWASIRYCLLAIGGSKGSKIIVTTRNHHACLTMEMASLIYRLQGLSEDESWNLFRKIAFADAGPKETQELVAIGRRILKKCRGVPLAIKAIAGLMYSQKDESQWLAIEDSDTWKLDGVLTTLRLSYDHLPSPSLKQCFSFCSIFPEDTIIEKEKLIQLWMAHGLLNSSANDRLEMESVGNNYFNILLWNSLLQDAKKDDCNSIVSCKMHNLVRDLALLTSENNFLTLKSGEVKDDIIAAHLSLILNGKILSRISDGTALKVKTLYLVGGFLGNVLTRFLHLRVLILEDFGVVELPRSIGKLKHLRYFDASRTSIKRLPDSIIKLYYLQTLRLKDLEEIPKGFENLINLRHFYLEDTEQNRTNCMLVGIGQLIHLQNLPFFVVNRDRPHQIEELGGLKKLKGALKIYGLENVWSNEAARKSDLSSKSNIQNLELHWALRNGIPEEFSDEDVLNVLMPHTNLKVLLIKNFQGINFASWMMLNSQSSSVLSNLVKISLVNCIWCTKLPALGHLPCLEVVCISSLHNVKFIGLEFYGLTTNFDTIRDAVAVFPALRELTLHDMSSLIEWMEPEHPAPPSVVAFPLLQKLSVGWCPKLTSLPDGLERCTSLSTLDIHSCPALQPKSLE